MKNRLRLYVDTSVFGGCFDDEFRADSNALIHLARTRKVELVLGELVLFEIAKAPGSVRKLVESLASLEMEQIPFSKDAGALAEAYLKAGILTRKSETDAGHVATATVTRADAIVSWNFKHIVQLQKMKLYNQVNLSKGYGFLEIVSPREVTLNEKD